MDPNKVVRDQWLDDQDLSQYGMSGQKGYVHVVVYANGKKTVSAYKYGKEGEAQDPFKTIDTIDVEQQKEWNNPPPTRVIGGQVTQYNPETGQYDRPIGASGGAVPSTENNPPPEKDQGGRHYVWRANPPGQAGGQWEDVGPGPENAQERQARIDSKPTVVNTNTTERFIVRSDGTQVPNPNYVPPKPEDKYSQTVQDKTTGTWWGLKKDGSGWEQIQGGPNTTVTRLPAGIGEFQPDATKPGYGLFERRAALLDLVAKGTITEAQMKEILAQDQALTTSLANQQSAVTTGANTAYDNLTTQRSQDITQADARLTAANTQSSNALTFANQNAVGIARSGVSDIFGPLQRMQTLNAVRAGGMETPDSVPLPKALSRYLTLDLPGMGKWKPADDGGAARDTAPGSGGSAAPPSAGPQPPTRDDYSTNADPSGGSPQADSAAISNMDPRSQTDSLFADDPEFASHVQRVRGMAA